MTSGEPNDSDEDFQEPQFGYAAPDEAGEADYEVPVEKTRGSVLDAVRGFEAQGSSVI